MPLKSQTKTFEGHLTYKSKTESTITTITFTNTFLLQTDNLTYSQ